MQMMPCPRPPQIVPQVRFEGASCVSFSYFAPSICAVAAKMTHSVTLQEITAPCSRLMPEHR